MIKYSFLPDEKNLFYNYKYSDYPIMHTHDHWEILIVIEGQIRHFINGQERTLAPNTMCLIRPKDCHSFEKTGKEPVKHINIGISDELIKKQLDLIDAGLYDGFLSSPPIELKISQRTAKYVTESSYQIQILDKESRSYGRIVMLLFLDLLKEIIRNTEENDSKRVVDSAPVKELAELMKNKDCIDQSVEELCKRLNYSHSYITKIFKKTFGIPPILYFQKIKMNYARSLLESTNTSILEIANSVGFSSLGHFNVVFKNTFGTPPAKYRKTWMNEYNAPSE